VSGQGLSGAELAKEREQEARKSLSGLGIQNSPIFLKFSDSHVKEYIDELKDSLLEVFKKVDPVVVISFGPDGITDDWDHKMTGFVTDQIFDITDSGKLLLHMVISQKANDKFRMSAPVDNSAIDLRVDGSDYTQARINSGDAHRTQLPQSIRERWNSIIHEVSIEEFIIARNRSGEKLIRDCFFKNISI
jgi:LmbE family N-acetylglucosaminyl deacetylase